MAAATKPERRVAAAGRARRAGRYRIAEPSPFDAGRETGSTGTRHRERVEERGSGERDRRLEEVVLTTWAALLAGHPVECPVCGGPLTAAAGCSTCGSRLS